ncbi:MAG: sortase domain-bontaining protein [Candidatus Dojkabacteria bacterium]|jgi:sortase (surface protein transpeptidase)
MGKKEVLEKINKVYVIFGFLLLTISLTLVIIPVWPYIWYRINPDETEKDTEKIVKAISEEAIQQKKDIQSSNIPELDTSLPEGKFVIIPKISVESPISTSKDYREGLKQGTWIVSDYGTPESPELPIILAAHRFGYTSWSIEKRNKVSYYNLPDTKEDDEILIYWNQREYKYRIYKSEESAYITDYSADLILYTCKFFNSPIRIFRYAERVQ